MEVDPDIAAAAALAARRRGRVAGVDVDVAARAASAALGLRQNRARPVSRGLDRRIREQFERHGTGRSAGPRDTGREIASGGDVTGVSAISSRGDQLDAIGVLTARRDRQGAGTAQIRRAAPE